MNFFLERKGYLFLFAGIGVVILFLFILGAILLRPIPPAKPVPPTPTPSKASSSDEDPYSAAYKKSTKKILQEERPALEQDQKVARFLEKLPVQGANFTAKYDIGTNTVTVTMDQSPAAQKEFNDYLSANGIQDTSVLPNFTIRYKDPNSPID